MTGEPPKLTPPEGTKSHLPRILYWSAYVAIIVLLAAGTFLLRAIGIPVWAAILIVATGAGFAIWFLEDSPLNPNRDLDKDPFNRNFFAVNLQMVRSWKLRGRDLDWQETPAANLPPHAARAFKDQLGVVPEASLEVDGLLWVAGERDWHGGYFDPPRFVIVGFDAAGNVKAADDLHAWPKRWRIPLSPVQGRWTS